MGKSNYNKTVEVDSAVSIEKGVVSSVIGRNTENLLELLDGRVKVSSEEFKSLIVSVDSHNIVAKVFLLEGTPYVFSESPMKYVIFREQVAERFSVGSQDVCIVGSAKLGFSTSPNKFGREFKEESDVDVVVISESLFYQGSFELFKYLNFIGPNLNDVRNKSDNKIGDSKVQVDQIDWVKIKEGLRNYTFNNFNPSLLPGDNEIRKDIFDKITSTSGLFLALQPQVFVSKIRCRIFKSWKAAEDYYSNSLRQLKYKIIGGGEYLEDPSAELRRDDIEDA